MSAKRQQILDRVHFVCARLQLTADKVVASHFSHLLREDFRAAPIKFQELSELIDHTLLKPDAKQAEVDALCAAAIQHRFKAVCVNSGRARAAVQYLQQHQGPTSTSRVRVAVVVGFPLGACESAVKAAEARFAAQELRVDELDMVMNVGKLKDEDYVGVFDDVRAVVSNAGSADVKVILETGYLNSQEIVDACILCSLAEANFVKTSTGFGPRGASREDVELMRAVVGDRLGVKASGGVRTRADADAMIAAGASRIGTSNGPAILAAASGSATQY